MKTLLSLFLFLSSFVVSSSKTRRSSRHNGFYSSNEVVDELMQASYIADVEKIEYLLSLDPDIISSHPPVFVNRIDTKHGRTSLMTCGLDPQGDFDMVDRNCTKIAKLLEAAGADLFHKDNYGWDALALGSIRGLTRYCKFLLQKNATIDSLDDYGRTPLMKAVAHAHWGVVKLLIEKGANLSLQDSNGQTALHHGALLVLGNDSYLASLEMILPYHHPLDSFVDKDGRTILMYAAIENHFALSQLLIAKGSDPNKRDYFGVSALQMAKDPNIQELFLNETVRAIEERHEAWLRETSLTGEYRHDCN